MASQQRNVYFECPHCGEDVLAGAKVCRECGASDESGWNEDDFGDDVGDHDDYQDPIYEQRAASPFDRESSASSVRFWVRLVVLAIIVSFLFSVGLL